MAADCSITVERREAHPRRRPARRAPGLLLSLLLVATTTVITAAAIPPAPAAARGQAQQTVLPPGFQDTVALSGLDSPTAVRFSPDGRVFVAEKSGVIKVFDSPADPTPGVFADLSTNVDNYWDRGLLGLALAPGFPADPHIYVLYTYDHELFSADPAPKWGTAGILSDSCPTPPGPTKDGCVASGRLSRLTAAGNTTTGSEQVLVEDWCQQFPSHSMGSLEFGRDGALYASGGDAASFSFADYGQVGNPLNPCGDPPTGAATTLTPPTAEGGALRSQDLRSPDDPVGLDGTIIRVDPATGEGLPSNPLAAATDANARRIIAHGLRNPFRFAARPGTDDLWIGDVGYGRREEIDILPTHGVVKNFGWPCYEGSSVQPSYQSAGLNLCQPLYADPTLVTKPWFSYSHSGQVVAGEACPTGSSSITGVAFAPTTGSTLYPTAYRGALFFADYSRDCIWVMPRGADGQPDRARVQTFAAGAANPVNLQWGPGGRLYYVDVEGGAIRTISHVTNLSPLAVLTAKPTSGVAPLTVAFDGSASSDPDGTPITYAWDLDGDGAYDDATAARPTWTYTRPGAVTARLRVTDVRGGTGTAATVITSGNSTPSPTIRTPLAGTRWKVGDTIRFSGSATDAQDGVLPASALTWALVMRHCPSTCHSHTVQTFSGVNAGSFVAPDHEYPSHLDLRLTARDSGGLTRTKVLALYPRTVKLTFATSHPTGLSLVVGDTKSRATFTRTVMVGSVNSISAPYRQKKGTRSYRFSSWSDGKARTHNIKAPSTARTYTARYR
ncbi:MAG: sugar dehydrogenase [Friedmanniella sp.]|nr:sugar dehydrogenase [Friedmanniella sp.]